MPRRFPPPWTVKPIPGGFGHLMLTAKGTKLTKGEKKKRLPDEEKASRTVTINLDELSHEAGGARNTHGHGHARISAHDALVRHSHGRQRAS